MDAGGLERLVLEHRPDILFFNCLNDSWVSQLRALPDWRPVYLDETAIIYLRRGYADTLPGIDYGNLAAREGVSTGILGEIPVLLRTPPPSAAKNFLEDFYQNPKFPSPLLNLGIFCGTNGHPETAELFFWEAVQRSQGRFYDCFYNLGLLYYYGGRRTEAVSCMKRVLRDQPNDPAALQIAGTALP
jgi:tetratricopeptide (TPR) repeat protein